ncbi:MAG: hypothetical protein JWP29_3096, partial [Rhodoferax sp.]|nr:hypothetical protein [Rhodoferax sp.]
LHCTETELREAVRAVGNSVADVRHHLGPRATEPNGVHTLSAFTPSTSSRASRA